MANPFTPIVGPDGKLQFEALLEQVAGVLSVYGGVQQDAQDLIDLCGGGRVVAWLSNPATVLPDLAVVQQGNHWFCWVAGTTNTQQWIANVTGAVSPIRVLDQGIAHSFFWLAAQQLLQIGQQFLPDPASVEKISLVGHSMGAAVAFALWLQLRGTYSAAQVELLQLCSPKLLGAGFPNASPAAHFRVRVPGDPVPMLPPDPVTLGAFAPVLGVAGYLSANVSWAHYGQGYQLSVEGRLADDPDAGWFASNPLAWLGGMDVSRHLIANVASYLIEGVVDPYPVTPRGYDVVRGLRTVIQRPAGRNQAIPFDPAAGLDPAQANRAYFGSDSGPISLATADGAQSLSVLVTSSTVRGGSNIQGLVGGSMPASGIWKFTAIINGQNYGKSTSVFWTGSVNLNDAVAKAKAWCEQLAFLFGNAGTASAYDDGPNDGSPVIVYVRVTDAKNPRFGMLVQLTGTNGEYSGEPGATAGDNAADFTSTALSLRMQGVMPDTPFTIGYSNHAILFQPDSVVTKGSQIKLSHVDARGKPYSYYVQQYLAYLTSQANSLGFCIIDPASLKLDCTAFAVSGTRWLVTCPGHTFGNGDRIRMTAANARGFNGTYVVSLNSQDANTFFLNSGPPTSVPAPTKAKAQQVQLSSGVKRIVFARFTLLPIQQTATFGLRVTKRNPGRPFTPVSFRRRARRLH